METATELPPSLYNLRAVFANIKDTLAAVILDLRRDIQAMHTRMEELEDTADQHSTDIQCLRQTSDSQDKQLRELHKHMEDLDNRSRRHNLRVRGIPETVEAGQLTQVTLSIFNDILGRPPEAPIEWERLHRALKPRARETAPPRDVICCLVNFRHPKGSQRTQGSFIPGHWNQDFSRSIAHYSTT